MSKTAYLTIDDSPDEGFFDKLDFLDSQGIKAIWYCLGKNLEQFPEEAVYAVKQGHILGNHSYDHPYFSELTEEECRSQIDRTEILLNAVYLKSGKDRLLKTFRFPYLDSGDGDHFGSCDWNHPRVRFLQDFLKKKGFARPLFETVEYAWFTNNGYADSISVDCTYDTYDWCLAENFEMHGYRDLPTILARMDEDKPEEGRGLNSSDSGEIVMMHAWIPTADFIAIVNKLLSKGLQFRLPEGIPLD